MYFTNEITIWVLFMFIVHPGFGDAYPNDVLHRFAQAGYIL